MTLRRVPVEGCLLHGHGGEECPGSRPGNPSGACKFHGTADGTYCPRSGSYTGDAYIETTMPADAEEEVAEHG